MDPHSILRVFSAVESLKSFVLDLATELRAKTANWIQHFKTATAISRPKTSKWASTKIRPGPKTPTKKETKTRSTNNCQAEKDKTSFELESNSEKTDKLSNDLEVEIKTLDNRLRMSIRDLIDSVVFPNFWRFPGTYFAKVPKNILNFFDWL